MSKQHPTKRKTAAINSLIIPIWLKDKPEIVIPNTEKLVGNYGWIISRHGTAVFISEAIIALAENDRQLKRVRPYIWYPEPGPPTGEVILAITTEVDNTQLNEAGLLGHLALLANRHFENLKKPYRLDRPEKTY